MSAVLDYVRSQEPFFKTVDDDTLTKYLGSTQPWTLEADPDLKTRYTEIERKELGGALEPVKVPDWKSVTTGTAPIIPEDVPSLPEQRERNPIESALRAARRIPAIEKLIGPEVPGTGPGGDIENRGILPTLFSMPGRVASTAGRAAQAGVADIASGVDARADKPTGAADFGGNLQELLAGHGQTRLPVERGLELSKAQDKEEGTLGWQTIAGDISLGLADMAPKIAMLEAAPGGMVAKAAPAASIFGTDEQGNVNPRNAAFAALFPFVTSTAAKVTDQAIEKAVARGFTWAGTPAGQNALHIASNQAAMDGLMLVQSTPELAQLQQTDPAEFKREVAKIIGSNLAFAIPEAMKRRGLIAGEGAEKQPPSALGQAGSEVGAGKVAAAANASSAAMNLAEGREPGQGPAVPPMPEVEQEQTERPAFPKGVRDLAAELKAAMTANQITERKPATEGEQNANVITSPSVTADKTVPAQGAQGTEPGAQGVPAITRPEQGPANEPGTAPGNAPGHEPDVPKRDETLESKTPPPSGQAPPENVAPEANGAQDLAQKGPAAPGTAVSVPEAPPANATHGSLELWADQTIKQAQGRLHAGLDPELLAAYAIKGAFHIARIARQVVLDFNEWSIQMLNEFGAAVGPHLRTVWPEALKLRQQQLAQEIPGTKEQSPERRNLAREASEVQQQILKAATAKKTAAPAKNDQVESDAGIEAQRAQAARAGTEDSSVLDQPPAQAAESSTVEPRDFHQVQQELDEASDALRESLKLNSNRQGRSRADVRQEQALAAARYHNLREELLTNPRYVEELIKRQQANLQELAGQPTQERRAQLEADREDIRGKLGEIDPKLGNQVYAAMLKDGRIPKPAPAAPVGRSLDAVTDDLRKAGAVSPKRSLLERLAIGDQVKDRWNNFKDRLEASRMKLATVWKAALESYKHPPVDNGFRNVVKDWLFADQWTGRQTHDFVRELNKKVEDPLRQMAISVWLDAKGDESLLKYQAAAVPERYLKVWRLATQLTPGEKALARQLKSDFDAKLEDALNAGLLQKGRADYGVPQLWKKAPVVEPNGLDQHGRPGNPQAKLDPRDPFFSFSRSHATYFDGILDGGIPKDLKISTLVAEYNQAFHKALSSRGMIFALKQETAADGMPVVKISGSARQVNDNEPGAYLVDSKGRTESDQAKDGRPYRSIDHFALRDWKLANKTPEGKSIMVRGDMLVHPDHFDFLKNELLNSPLREGPLGRALSPVLNSSAYLKASKMAFAGFHLMTIGEHMVSHLVNPFTNGFRIDLRQPDQALLVRNGLELGMSGPQAAFEEGLASHGGLFSQIPGLGDFSAKLTDWMFKDYIPTIAMKTGLHVLDANRRRYGKELSEGQIAELTAGQMNAASGLQNYRLLGRNKVLMDLNRMALLAPTFLEARAKVVAQALKPYGAEQRKMLIVQAAVLYAGCRVLNMLLDDDPHFEEAAAFGVVHKGRMYGIRSIVGDTWHLFNDPGSFAAGRLSPLAKLTYETVTQRDLRTGARKEPPIETEWKPFRVAQNLVVDLAKWLLPIGIEGVLPGAAGREQGPMTTAAAAFGVGSHKYTAQTQVYKWAEDFNRQGDAAARTFQRHQDAAVHAEGTYRKLDALLDAGRLGQASTEYEALLKDGHKRENISQRFYQTGRPFTGTQARDAAFRASLSASQQKIYDRAIQERVARQQAFQSMMQWRAQNGTEPPTQ